MGIDAILDAIEKNPDVSRGDYLRNYIWEERQSIS